METKHCPKCGEIKPVDLFRNNKKQPDGLYRICKACCKIYEQKAYRKNPKKYLEDSTERKKKYVDEFTQYKSTLSCKSCGESRYWVLDFHHIDPSKKNFNIADFMFKSPLVNILPEIELCEVLCRNCHYEFHHLERTENMNLDAYLNDPQYGN
jgi:hypothetical protein